MNTMGIVCLFTIHVPGHLLFGENVDDALELTSRNLPFGMRGTDSTWSPFGISGASG